MTETTKKTDTYVNSGTSPPSPDFAREKHDEQPLTAEERKQRRTLGLKLFDIGLYPLLNNFIVFGISVAATYFTSKGDVHGGAVGRVFYDRGKWMEGQFSKIMPEKSATMAKMVFFSFFDGTLLSPIVKLFEDRREKIGKWIDDKLGTTPENLSVYDAEPKQTWGSVIKGRIASGMIVLPTAIAFDKTGINDKLFTGVGNKLGSYIESKPRLAKKFGQADIHEISKIGVFEAVYTSICTAGLYMFSRAFARHHDEKIGRTEIDPATHKVVLHHPANDNPPLKAENDDDLAHPRAQVSAVEAQSRIAVKAPEAALGQ